MLSLIEQRLPDLSRAEQRVARFVLAHPRQAANAKLAALAGACETSEPTVIRFCRHIGLDGFRQFTIRLTEALSSPALFVHRSVSQQDGTDDAVAKVMDASIRALIDVRARTASMPFEDAVSRLQNARQLTFVGLGASGHVANDACQKFFRLSLPCTAISDRPTMLQMASVALEEDVFIIVSLSGEALELIRTAEIALSKGATVMAFTDPVSSLADVANLVFDCQTAEDASLYTPQSSRLAHLALLDALQVALALTLGNLATQNLQDSKVVLDAWNVASAGTCPRQNRPEKRQ